MNFNCSRFLLQCSSILVRNHCRKSHKTLANISIRYLSASSPRYFSTRKGAVEDLKNEFESFEDATEPNYKDVNIEEITKGNPEKIKRLKLCQMEVNFKFQNGEQVPECMTSDNWCELIKLTHKSQRDQYLRFLWLNEVKRESEKRKKLKKHEEYLEMKALLGNKERIDQPTNIPMKYGLSHVSIVHRFRDAEINRFYNYKVLQAMIHGPQIVVDCGYEPYMNSKEMNLCTKQILLMWAENRDNTYPFDVLFCNFKQSSPIFQKMCKMFNGAENDPLFPFNYTEKHYLDLYPKERLVYLTPHCNETLDKFDGNDIYIIGAMVDKSSHEHISLAKAKKEGIRYAKFPLDRYLNWKIGCKSLTLNQCLGIMSDLKDGRDWPYAFRHVPRRKISENFINQETKEIRGTRFAAKSIRERYRRNIVYDLLLPKK